MSSALLKHRLKWSTNSGGTSFKDRRQVKSQPRVEPHNRTFLGSAFVVSVLVGGVTRMTKPSSSLTNQTRQTDHWTSFIAINADIEKRCAEEGFNFLRECQL